MAARKAYIRLLVSIIIYSSGFIDLFFTTTTPKVLLFLTLFVWSVSPILKGGKGTRETPFGGDKLTQVLLSVFVIWQMLVLLRGVVVNYKIVGVLGQLGNQYSIFAFLMPLLIYLNPRYFNFRQFVKILTIIGILFIAYVIVNRNSFFDASMVDTSVSMLLSDDEIETRRRWLKKMMYLGKVFLMFGFIMFLPVFLGKKRYFFILICWAIALFSCVIGGRRGQSVTLIIMGLFSFYFYVNRKSHSGRGIRWLLILGSVFAIAYYIYSSFSDMFSIMESRIGDDSRTGLYYFFWHDLGNGFDWVWGRGVGGTYYCPMNQDGELVQYRNAIEAGFLHIILSGGIISLTLYVLVLLSAVIKGFFHTKNHLTKAFAAYIAVSLFNLIPFGLPECSVTFFVVWVGAAICGSPYYRNMTDEEVKQLFR